MLLTLLTSGCQWVASSISARATAMCCSQGHARHTIHRPALHLLWTCHLTGSCRLCHVPEPMPWPCPCSMFSLCRHHQIRDLLRRKPAYAKLTSKHRRDCATTPPWSSASMWQSGHGWTEPRDPRRPDSAAAAAVLLGNPCTDTEKGDLTGGRSRANTHGARATGCHPLKPLPSLQARLTTFHPLRQ